MLIENLIFWRRLQKGCEEVWLSLGGSWGVNLWTFIFRGAGKSFQGLLLLKWEMVLDLVFRVINGVLNTRGEP